MSKQLRLDVAQLTDVGRKRPHNEDNMAYVIPKDMQVMARKGALFIVADGMGGHAAGEVASEIAVDTVSNVYYQDDNEDVAVSLLHAIKRANSLIHQRAAENMLRSGMGTTCVAAVLRGGTAYIANVGDSRAYLVRGGVAKQVSQDHSWVEEQVRAGLLTRDQARSHAQRNVITRCLGTQADVEVDVFSEALEEGDSLVLCTDGLSGLVGDDELRTIVSQYVPQESVYHLVERANENGGPDNITAIVIRVQEVGWEPPAARRPVYVGGPEVSEDTALLGKLPGSALGLPSRPESSNGRIISSPLRMSSGPLLSPESVTAPQPALPAARPTRNRLFYPTLVVFVVLVLALIGGGLYYFLHGPFTSPVDVSATLQKASSLIQQADQEVSSDPADALQKLADAQKDLRVVQSMSSSLTSSQRTQYTTLVQGGSFASAVKAAITSYNKQSSITALSTAVPCVNTVVAAVSAGTTNTQANSIATIQDEKGAKTFFYGLGVDHNLYQLNDQHALADKVMLPGNPQVMMIASDGQRVLALSELPANGNNPATYTLNLLLPTATGGLNDSGTASIDATRVKQGFLPTLMTAWGQDVYVMLTSVQQPNTVMILDYVVNANKLGQSPREATISVSTSIISLVAWPKNQLFLLHSNGDVQSLQFDTGSLAAVSVVLDRSIAQPLTIAASDFTPTMDVPVPVAQSSTFLSVPRATQLAAGLVDGTPHLYILDDMDHRVLDLLVPQGITANTTTPTPTPTTAATAGTGGGVATAGSQVTLHLLAQYTSVTLLTGVKSIVADPKIAELYLLAQNGQNGATLNLVTIDMRQQNTCAS